MSNILIPISLACFKIALKKIKTGNFFAFQVVMLQLCLLEHLLYKLRHIYILFTGQNLQDFWGYRVFDKIRSGLVKTSCIKFQFKKPHRAGCLIKKTTLLFSKQPVWK